MVSLVKRGFTLIEVLVAVSIFSLSIVGLLSIVAISQRNFVDSRLYAKAIFLAEQKMNEVFRLEYQTIDEEEDESYILDETDDENPIEMIVREGEFYDESYKSYEEIQREEWLKDYYWQVIFKESEELLGMQMVFVRVFYKKFTGENEYTDVKYGQVAELVTYITSKKKSQENKRDE